MLDDERRTKTRVTATVSTRLPRIGPPHARTPRNHQQAPTLPAVLRQRGLHLSIIGFTVVLSLVTLLVPASAPARPKAQPIEASTVLRPAQHQTSSVSLESAPITATAPFVCEGATSHSYGFETCTFTGARLGSMTFYLYLPTGFNSGATFPMVVLLHGGDERARSDYSPAENAALLLDQQYVHTWSSSAVQGQWPSVIVVPQVEGNLRFVNEPIHNASFSLPAQPSSWIQLTMAIAEAIQQQYTQIDPSRRYVTGISMGAVATWAIIERWPNYFAAAAPLSGAGDPAHANRLVSQPIWAFHAANDTLIPVQATRQMVAAIRQAGGSPKYTEYAGVGHDIWNTEHVYTNSAFLSWLFAQHNPSPAPGP